MSPVNSSFLFVLCISIVEEKSGAKILGLFFMPTISHQVFYQPIWRELSLRGHNVTVISPNILNDPKLINLTEIDVGFSYEIMKEMDIQTNLAKDNLLVKNFFFTQKFLQKIITADLDCEAVQKLLGSEEEFDLLLVEALHPLVFGLGGRFKAPIIGLSSIEIFLHTYDIFGNPTHPVLRPDVLMIFESEPTFGDRLSSFLFNIWARIFYYWSILPHSDGIARQYFGKDMPYLGEIIQNTSLMLINSNPIMHTPRPNAPSIVEIGQMHIKEKKPLPKDLQKYLDSSTQGVVYLSFGSNIKSANLSEELRETIKQALAELPFNVIWKWEADDLPGKPENVRISKWLPQQDILGHPNVKVFVTQGGLQSIEEAIVNGVPMVGIPFFIDQPKNVKVLEEKGMAIRLDYTTMTTDELKRAILEVATNSKFKEQMQKSKNILLDQPMTGLNKAIWWIEYVLRHKGARHLRSPAADMSFFEYFMVDVVGFLLISFCIGFYCLTRVLRLIVNYRRSKSKTD